MEATPVTLSLANPNEIRFLLVSDTHEQNYMLERVVALYPDVDAIIHSGDFTNGPMNTVNDEVDLWLAKIREQLGILEALQKPIYYIMGNHDPK
jgi:predicted phosphodiesterase